MKIKKIIASVLCLILMSNVVALPVSARWSNTSYVVMSHNNASGTAQCEIIIQGYSGTTEIDNVDVKLYLYTGSVLIQVASWDDLSADGDRFHFYDEVNGVLSGYTYRLAFTADVHRNGTIESLDQHKDVAY